MIDYDAIASEKLSDSEKIVCKAMIQDFKSFCPDETTLRDISKADMLAWCAAGGLNYETAQRRLRWCSAVYEYCGVINLVANASYDNLDFSEDLKLHYFDCESRMICCVEEVARQIPTRRPDMPEIVMSLAALAWEGYTQGDILSLYLDCISYDRDRYMLSFGGRKHEISEITYEVLNNLIEVKLENGATKDDLMFTAVDGTPWKRVNASEIMFRVNEISKSTVQKEFLTPKLAENGLFERIRMIREERHCSPGDAMTLIQIGTVKQWRFKKSHGYYHWEKYFHNI